MTTDENAGRQPNNSIDKIKVLKLKDFLPYKLLVLSDFLSRWLSKFYENEFDLSRQEWRVLASVTEGGSMSSVDASKYTTLDPMAVSRASNLLEQKGYITKNEHTDDKRVKIFEATESGIQLYNKIVPMAIEREEYLTEPFTPEERMSLDEMINKLMARATFPPETDVRQRRKKSPRPKKGDI